MDSNINESADKLAKSLDERPEEEVATAFLSELSKYADRQDRINLVDSVDQRERDGINLDLILKKDQEGSTMAYTILPAEMHQSARQMATLMDAGNVHQAMELASSVKASIKSESSDADPQSAIKRFAQWSIAVDAYETDGVGEDVSINYYKNRSTNPRYSFRLHRERA